MNRLKRKYLWVHFLLRKKDNYTRRPSPSRVLFLFRPPFPGGPILCHGEVLLVCFVRLCLYKLKTNLFREHFQGCCLAVGQTAPWILALLCLVFLKISPFRPGQTKWSASLILRTVQKGEKRLYEMRENLAPSPAFPRILS